MCKDVHQEFTSAYNRRKWINENPFYVAPIQVALDSSGFRLKWCHN
jgi:hypothetical protein